MQACIGFRQLTPRWKSQSYYTPPETPRLHLLCFLCSLSCIFISCFNLLSTLCVPIKETCSVQSSQHIDGVPSSPHLGIRGTFWLLVKYFHKDHLSGFHIITLTGQTLNRSGGKVLRGSGGRESSSRKCFGSFIARKRWLGQKIIAGFVSTLRLRNK